MVPLWPFVVHLCRVWCLYLCVCTRWLVLYSGNGYIHSANKCVTFSVNAYLLQLVNCRYTIAERRPSIWPDVGCAAKWTSNWYLLSFVIIYGGSLIRISNVKKLTKLRIVIVHVFMCLHVPSYGFVCLVVIHIRPPPPETFDNM